MSTYTVLFVSSKVLADKSDKGFFENTCMLMVIMILPIKFAIREIYLSFRNTQASYWLFNMINIHQDAIYDTSFYHIHVCILSHIHVHLSHLRILLYLFSIISSHIYIYTYMHTYIHAYIHTYIQTYRTYRQTDIHTYIHSQ